MASTESEFNYKIQKACNKKVALYQESKLRYLIRSIYAGAFLTMTTAAGAGAAQMINSLNPALGKFFFSFIFSWGLVYILFLNSELATSNMMYLTTGVYQKAIKWTKALEILLVCTLGNLLGAILLGWAFSRTGAFLDLDVHHFIAHVVELKLSRGNSQVFLEAIIANVFVNTAILAFLLMKEEGSRINVVLSAIFMFVFLSNEHVVANFASFAIVKFSAIGSSYEWLHWTNILRHWFVAFMGNWLGGGLLIGVAYGYLNKTKTVYHE